MKILLVVKKFGYSGGTEQYILGLIEDLSYMGHEISLLYAKNTGRRSLNTENLLKKKYGFPVLDAYPGLSTDKSEKEVGGIIEDINPEIIYMCDILNYRLIDVFLRMRPTIAIEHYEGLFCLRGSKTFFLSRKICKEKLGLACFLHGCFLGKHTKRTFISIWSNMYHAKKRLNVYKKMPRILVASKYMKERFLENGFGADKVFVIPHYTYIPDETETIYPADGNKVLFVGRIDRYKGLDFLIKAVSIMHTDVKLVVAGEGSWAIKMKRLAEKINVSNKIEFRGWLSKEKIKELYIESSVVVFPSIWPEPFGLVGIEAMAYARPVVAYDVGGISDWLRDNETGFLVTPKDIKELARAIERILKNKSLSVKMGKAGREYVISNFNKDQNLTKLMKHFYEIIETKNNEKKYKENYRTFI